MPRQSLRGNGVEQPALGFLPTTDQWVPHISLVFLEMWETRTFLGSFWRVKNCSLYPPTLRSVVRKEFINDEFSRTL
jgi:hypothetical protein